jgi:DNA sulfur modification protein DndE
MEWLVPRIPGSSRPEVTRLALGRSLAEPTTPTFEEAPEQVFPAYKDHIHAPAIRIQNLFSDGSWQIWSQLITLHCSNCDAAETEPVSAFRLHWERGLVLLYQDWRNTGNLDAFLARMLRKTNELPSSITAVSREVGAELLTNANTVAWNVGFDRQNTSLHLHPTRAAHHDNPHLAIAGRSGSGKTSLVKLLLRQLRSKSDAPGFIFIDYAKGDVADDSAFVKDTGARVFTLPGQEALPLQPFSRSPDVPERVIADEMVDAISDLLPAIGPVQRQRLLQAITSAFDRCRDGPYDCPDFPAIVEELERDEARLDSLTEVMSRLNDHHLFWERGEPLEKSDLGRQPWIVDLHLLPERLRQVAAFGILLGLYRWMTRLKDIELEDDGTDRPLRLYLVIDEAREYVARRNYFLREIIRLGRSRGVGVILLTQGLDELSTPHFDYLRECCFRVALRPPGDAKAVGLFFKIQREQAQRLTAQNREDDGPCVGLLAPTTEPPEGAPKWFTFRPLLPSRQ